MEQETEKIDDYYILFRDVVPPAPEPGAKRIKKRCLRQDLLVGDRARYAWGYVGELSEKQAETVKISLDSEVNNRFPSPAASLNDTGGIRITLSKHHNSATLSFFSHVSPCLGFLAHVPLNHSFRIFPKSAEDKQQICDALNSFSSQINFGFEFSHILSKNESPKQYSSFVELLSLQTLMDMWRCFGYDPSMGLLRRTAGIWLLKTLGEQDTIRTADYTRCPQDTKTDFNLIVLEDDHYLHKLTARQLKVLAKCVHITNDVRRREDCKDKNIKNRYGAQRNEYRRLRRIKEKKEWTWEQEQLKEKNEWAREREKERVERAKEQRKQKEERKKQREKERARANVDDRSSLAVLDTPILTKIPKQFAYISTTRSQKCEKSKSEEPHLTQAASGQDVSPIIIDAKLTEQIEMPTDAPGGTLGCLLCYRASPVDNVVCRPTLRIPVPKACEGNTWAVSAALTSSCSLLS